MTTNNAALDTERLSPAEFDALKADAEAAADKAMRGTYTFDPLAEPVTQREVVDLFVGALQAKVRADIAAQPRVRILRGGYRGDLGRISGVGRSGGHIVTTDSGILLGMAEHDIERLGKA
jgi:hypothetical protein